MSRLPALSSSTKPPCCTSDNLCAARVAARQLIAELGEAVNKVLRDRVDDAAADGAPSAPTLEPRPHPVLHDVVELPSLPAVDVTLGGPELVIAKSAGMAVLRGSDIFAMGVIAGSRDVTRGSRVTVSIGLHHAHSRGCDVAEYAGERVPIAVGVAHMSCDEIFRARRGLAVAVSGTVCAKAPPLRDVCAGKMMLQNSPSVVAAAALGCRPGEAVLDMCAGVGGKTTHLACAMEGRGLVVALDKSAHQLERLVQRCDEFGVPNCVVAVADSTDIVAEAAKESDVPHAGATDAAAGEPAGADTACCAKLRDFIAEQGLKPVAVGGGESAGGAGGDVWKQRPVVQRLGDVRFPAASFDRVLVDPPCTSLGLRPHLRHHVTVKDVAASAQRQRELLRSAVALLRPGGTLVYSTCTLTPAENEETVRWAADTLPLRLVHHTPRLVDERARHNGCLSDAEADMVQRFDPAGPADTVGFFVSRWERTD